MRPAPFALALFALVACGTGETAESPLLAGSGAPTASPSELPAAPAPATTMGGGGPPAGPSASHPPSEPATAPTHAADGTAPPTLGASAGDGACSNGDSSTGCGACTAPSCDTSDEPDATSRPPDTDEAAAGAGTAALKALREHLALPRDMRPPIHLEPFSSVGLSSAEAGTARELLWQDHAAWVRETRQAESEAKAITAGEHTLRYDFRVFGDKPDSGRSLFISLHGGGEAAPSVNDQQWENQKTLYQPSEGVYLAPRAPTDTWNLWHEAHVDGLLRRLIENFIALEEVDPNRVYLMGYSAGGDGVYQLAPRMADSFAAAAMMAGHPNDAKPDNLRNLGFTLHVGGQDTAFDRHLVAAEWGSALDELRAADPSGYPHEVHIHPTKGHWMDLEDAVAVPWMAEFTRNPVPAHVVWLQDDVPHERLYWLAVPPEQAQKETRVVATCDGQRIHIAADGVQTLHVRLSDALLDLDQPIEIETDSGTLHSGVVPRTIAALARTLAERGDPAAVYPAEVTVEL